MAAASGSTPTFMKVPFGKVGGDIRVQFTRPASNTTLTSFLVGPRLEVHPHVIPLNPYAEFLFGGGHFSYGNNSPSPHSSTGAPLAGPG